MCWVIMICWTTADLPYLQVLVFATSFVNFICNQPQISTCVALRSFTDMRRAMVRILSYPLCVCLRWRLNEGHCPLVSAVVVNSCPPHGLCSITFCMFLCFLLVISVSHGPQVWAGVLSGVLRYKNSGKCLTERNTCVTWASFRHELQGC